MSEPEYGESIIMPLAEREAAEAELQSETPEAGQAHSISDWLDTAPQGGSMPTPEDVASTNTDNAEARAKAVADGLDEGTADILYPQFDTPEDMLKIN